MSHLGQCPSAAPSSLFKNASTTLSARHSEATGSPTVLRLAHPANPPGIDLTSRSSLHAPRSDRYTRSSSFQSATPQARSASVVVGPGIVDRSGDDSQSAEFRFRLMGVLTYPPGRKRGSSSSLSRPKRERATERDRLRLRRLATTSSSASKQQLILRHFLGRDSACESRRFIRLHPTSTRSTGRFGHHAALDIRVVL